MNVEDTKIPQVLSTGEVERVLRERDALRGAASATLAWAAQRCPCHNDEPRICPLCQADVAKDPCLSAENTIPRSLLEDLRRALAKG